MPDILHRIAVNTPPERVWAAITTTEGLRGWWTRTALAGTQKGELTVLEFAGGEVVFRMRIDVIEPPRQLEWQCVGDWEEWTGTRLTWNLEARDDGGTVVQFAHLDWKTTDGEYPQCNATWGHLMHVLRDWAEGKPTEPPFPG